MVQVNVEVPVEKVIIKEIEKIKEVPIEKIVVEKEIVEVVVEKVTIDI